MIEEIVYSLWKHKVVKGDSLIVSVDKVLLEVQKPTLPVFCEAVKGNKSCCDTIEPLIQANVLALNDKKYNIGIQFIYLLASFYILISKY